MAVYCLEFTHPIGNPNKKYGTAQTYIGYCGDGRIFDRLHEHQSGNGAALTRFAVENGINWRVVFVIEGVFGDTERKMKQYKNTKKLIEQYERNPFAFVKRWKDKAA